ncbi:TPA: hypothetical protein R4O50_001208 [Campylobacter coli]|nr:hypothetical protein [Campylobacter coli]MCE4869711.1 hypothetical protein [Campylobacter coli]MCH3765259.1 hypothetical protein [Campylobacter coli]MCH3771776.1 hypothetical protein [Campylobacter coli]HED0763745.1 hypothetical protein [Campylobacter coli]HED1048839.1 hypothetical protein [Campylobacter coli]
MNIETLASNYGGIYIFDKKIREEILELEKKKEKNFVVSIWVVKLK